MEKQENLSSYGLLNCIGMEIISKVIEDLKCRLNEYEEAWDEFDEEEDKNQQARMLLYYNQAVDLYNEYSVFKIEKQSFPKTESWPILNT